MWFNYKKWGVNQEQKLEFHQEQRAFHQEQMRISPRKREIEPTKKGITFKDPKMVAANNVSTLRGS